MQEGNAGLHTRFRRVSPPLFFVLLLLCKGNWAPGFLMLVSAYFICLSELRIWEEAMHALA